jgi:membrane fusion protein, multidrug efflux system
MRCRPAVIALALVALCGAGVGAWFLWQHGAPAALPQQAGSVRGGGAPVPVTTAAAQQQDVPILLEALGTAQALNTITVRAQVNGLLVEIAFREGHQVREGDVLARIDSRPYQAALDQVVAKRAQDEALLANARLDLQRYTALGRNEVASRQQQDTQRAQVAQYEAQVQADKAAIESARTQLSFTTIRSPIDGRVGLRLVDQGNLVRAGDATGIVTVAQLQPIAVVFTLPQQELGRVLDALERGPVPVQASTRAGTVAEGALLALDNSVDQQTGTIKLKASFPNEDNRLWPGAFVSVRLQVDTVLDATTVPLVSVQRGPDGPYAFVLTPNQTAEQRPLRLGALTAAAAVVQQGLQPGERVVTSGAVRLTPGAPVAVSEPAAPPGAAPEPGRTLQPQRGGNPRQAADAARP